MRCALVCMAHAQPPNLAVQVMIRSFVPRCSKQPGTIVEAYNFQLFCNPCVISWLTCSVGWWSWLCGYCHRRNSRKLLAKTSPTAARRPSNTRPGETGLWWSVELWVEQNQSNKMISWAEVMFLSSDCKWVACWIAIALKLARIIGPTHVQFLSEHWHIYCTETDGSSL